MIPHLIWKYFKRSDFACKCGCGFDTLDVELADVVVDLRINCDDPLFVNSGCRCPAHNKKERGSKKSYHLKGQAVDLRFKTVSVDEACDWLEARYPDKYGIIRYNGRFHLDIRNVRYRDDMRR